MEFSVPVAGFGLAILVLETRALGQAKLHRFMKLGRKRLSSRLPSKHLEIGSKSDRIEPTHGFAASRLTVIAEVDSLQN